MQNVYQTCDPGRGKFHSLEMTAPAFPRRYRTIIEDFYAPLHESETGCCKSYLSLEGRQVR